MILKTGDRVRVRSLNHPGDEWTTAVVALASSNGLSVALRLDGAVHDAGGAVVLGVLPLSIDYEARTFTSLMGGEYEIEVAGMSAGGTHAS